uniref:Uncharacterized protein n=1 Tax=Oryza sativa subsp. japonica TaxID=39947 RepID=Q6EUG7_ORYSJ|nr:hypothetical protein [Oryza sativa Japonica Group]
MVGPTWASLVIHSPRLLPTRPAGGGGARDDLEDEDAGELCLDGDTDGAGGSATRPAGGGGARDDLEDEDARELRLDGDADGKCLDVDDEEGEEEVWT